MSDATKERMRNSSLGNTHGFKKGRMKEETRLKIVKSLIGNKRGIGYKHTKEWRENASKRMSKQNHPQWISDRSKRIDVNTMSPLYCEWRLSVYKRDGYICKISNDSCKGKIEAHHILRKSLYPELMFNLNNGITLCQFHHPRKIKEEKKFIPVFKNLIEIPWL